MKLIILEITGYLTVLAVWYFFRKIAKRNLTGDILIGAVIGFFLEFSTEPVCDYYFKITIYKDLPLIVPFAWGMMFALTVFMSEKLYRLAIRRKAIIPGDKRIFLCDIAGGVLVGFPLETAGTFLGIWKYNYDAIGWTMGKMPLVGMPYEALIAYALIMLTCPTIVRFWQGAFEGRL